MFARFLLLPIILPRAALALTGLVATYGFGEDGVVPTLGTWLLATFWTFLSATGAAPYRAPRREPEPRTREERKELKEQESEAFHRGALIFLWVVLAILLGGAFFLSAVQATTGERDWPGFILVVAAADGVVTLLLLWWFNGWASFVRAEAWREVRRAHKRYRRLIADECPLPVILAELHALGSDVSPAQAWKAANEILRRIHDTARKAKAELAKAEAARVAEEQERKKPEPLPLPPEESTVTPPLDLDDEPAAPVTAPSKPAPDLRPEWEATRERIKEEAKRMSLPDDIVVAELERIDEEYRKRMGGSA